MCKFACTTYEDILTDLRSFLRALEFNDKEFLDYVKVLDDIIIDMCPLSDKFEDKYNKMSIQQYILFYYRLMIGYETNVAHKNLM